MTERLEIDCLVIGAGVVGLALAEAISRKAKGGTVVFVDKHRKFGQEISSHNSEVVHAGIYYRGCPSKGRFCIEGRERLYEFCRRHDVPHRNCGKYIIATEHAQVGKLEEIRAYSEDLGVPIEEVDAARARQELGNPAIVSLLWSPTTGIVDSHVLMERLETQAIGNGAIPLYGHRFIEVLSREPGRIEVRLADPSGASLAVVCRHFVNAAGMASAKIASVFMPETGWEIRPCRGRYFSLKGRWTRRFERLLYPIPDPRGGLGVHLTFDLTGRCRLGPDVDWSSAQGVEPDDPVLYQFTASDEAERSTFFQAGKRLLPGLELDDLAPDYIGVRPKLFARGKSSPDFEIVVGDERSTDWHFLGIESPGLTASLALAREYAPRVLERG